MSSVGLGPSKTCLVDVCFPDFTPVFLVMIVAQPWK